MSKITSLTSWSSDSAGGTSVGRAHGNAWGVTQIARNRRVLGRDLPTMRKRLSLLLLDWTLWLAWSPSRCRRRSQRRERGTVTVEYVVLLSTVAIGPVRGKVTDSTNKITDLPVEDKGTGQ